MDKMNISTEKNIQKGPVTKVPKSTISLSKLFQYKQNMLLY